MEAVFIMTVPIVILGITYLRYPEELQDPTTLSIPEDFLKLLTRGIEACNTFSIMIAVTPNLDARTIATALTLIADFPKLEMIFKAFSGWP